MSDLVINNTMYTVVGKTDERTACECCGRQNLKGTVVLAPTNGGEYVFFGSGCAAKAAGWTKKDVDKAVKDAENAARAALAVRKASLQKDLTAFLAPFQAAVDAARNELAAGMRNKAERGELNRLHAAVNELGNDLYAQEAAFWQHML